MRFSVLIFWVSILAGLAASAQTPNPNAIIGGVGNSFPPLPVAPGQLVTFFVPNSGITLQVPYKTQQATLPNSLAGFSAIFRQGSDTPMPILMVQPVSTCTVPAVPPLGGGLSSPSSCGGTIAVTVQIPFEIDTVCPLCTPSQVAIAINGTAGPFIDAYPVSGQVHFMTACDLTAPGAPTGYILARQPCPHLVKHGNGTPVSPQRPGKGGEELVVYAIGLGQTDPPMTTGKGANGPARGAFGVSLDFNYRPNALATQPAPSIGDASPAPSIVYIGATPGYAGLYQMNFIVPPPPPGLAPCDNRTAREGVYMVQSNLTVSLGLGDSFDGFGICVQPD